MYPTAHLGVWLASSNLIEAAHRLLQTLPSGLVTELEGVNA
jgi:hypothetical protein